MFITSNCHGYSQHLCEKHLDSINVKQSNEKLYVKQQPSIPPCAGWLHILTPLQEVVLNLNRAQVLTLLASCVIGKQKQYPNGDTGVFCSEQIWRWKLYSVVLLRSSCKIRPQCMWRWLKKPQHLLSHKLQHDRSRQSGIGLPRKQFHGSKNSLQWGTVNNLCRSSLPRESLTNQRSQVRLIKCHSKRNDGMEKATTLVAQRKKVSRLTLKFSYTSIGMKSTTVKLWIKDENRITTLCMFGLCASQQLACLGLAVDHVTMRICVIFLFIQNFRKKSSKLKTFSNSLCKKCQFIRNHRRIKDIFSWSPHELKNCPNLRFLPITVPFSK